MTFADLLALLGAITGIMALVATIFRDRNKPDVDHNEADRLNAETRRIIADMSRDQEKEMAILRHEVHELRRRFDIATDYARTFYNGAVSNADYIRRNHNEQPPYDPPLEFPKIPTGPLGAIIQ